MRLTLKFLRRSARLGHGDALDDPAGREVTDYAPGATTVAKLGQNDWKRDRTIEQDKEGHIVKISN